MSINVNTPDHHDEPSSPLHAGPEVRARRPRLAAIVAGLLAAIATWAAGEAASGAFPQPRPVDPMSGGAPDDAEFRRVVVKNATLALGLQGALLGLALGVAGAVALGTGVRGVLKPGLAGLLLGGVLGATGGIGVYTAFYAFTDANSHDLIPSLLMHAVVASLVGAAGGAAFGLGLGGKGRVVRGLFGGLAGAALGGIVYEVVGAALFPGDKTDAPLAASWMPRLLFHALVDVLAAVGAALVIESTPPDRAATAD